MSARPARVSVDASPWRCPFAPGPGRAERYGRWLSAQPHLLRMGRRDLARRVFPPCDWPVSVLESAVSDGGPAEEPVFVFGSNLAGRHGRGAAFFAARYRGAQHGVGEGMTGRSYALPTKDERWTPRPLAAIADSVRQLLELARSTPDVQYLVTRVGCGLAGYRDEAVAPMFEGAPGNVDLPERWRQLLGAPRTPVVIVAHPRDYEAHSHIQQQLDHLLSRSSGARIITGHWGSGADHGAAYALRRWPESDVPFLAYPPDEAAYGAAAGMVRFQEMARAATHLVAFRSPTSAEVAALVRLAGQDGLITRIFDV